jgi:hypothetical protein
MKGNAVEVRTSRGAVITTSFYHVLLVESAKSLGTKLSFTLPKAEADNGGGEG